MVLSNSSKGAFELQYMGRHFGAWDLLLPPPLLLLLPFMTINILTIASVVCSAWVGRGH